MRPFSVTIPTYKKRKADLLHSIDMNSIFDLLTQFSDIAIVFHADT